MKDISFEIDDFSKGKIYNDVYAYAMQLYILLNMVPGDNPDDIEKGIDISKYRVGFSDETAISLKQEVMVQVEKYCDFGIDDVAVIFQNGEIYLGIQTTSSSSDFFIYQTTGDSVLMTVKNS